MRRLQPQHFRDAAARPARRSALHERSARACATVTVTCALIVSLAWHTREAAVLAIEERDGVRFFVVPNSALKPIELVRTPGLRSDRLNSRAF